MPRNEEFLWGRWGWGACSIFRTKPEVVLGKKGLLVNLNDKRLNEVRQAFEQAMPLGKPKKKSKNKPKKR